MLILALLIIAKLEQQRPTTFSGPLFAIDGDTLSVAGERLRIVGIDAPENGQTCQRAGDSWPCGQEARSALIRLVAARDVICEGASRDRYERLLVRCSGASGDIGAAMVRQGIAVAYGRYTAEEAQARQARSGLWAGTFERPQDFRRRAGMADDLEGDPWLSDLLDWLFGRS